MTVVYSWINNIISSMNVDLRVCNDDVTDLASRIFTLLLLVNVTVHRNLELLKCFFNFGRYLYSQMGVKSYVS